MLVLMQDSLEIARVIESVGTDEDSIIMLELSRRWEVFRGGMFLPHAHFAVDSWPSAASRRWTAVTSRCLIEKHFPSSYQLVLASHTIIPVRARPWRCIGPIDILRVMRTCKPRATDQSAAHRVIKKTAPGALQISKP